MKPRIALIGLGMAVTPHAQGLVELADLCEVVAAYSPTAERRAKFGARFPFPLADDLDRILADRSIDAVGILTPANTHRDLVLRAAKAGKQILLEKPLEISTERAEELVQAAEAAGVALAVMLQYRFRNAGERLREIVSSGGLGTMVSCSTSIRFWRPQSYYGEPGRGTRARDGGGVLLTQGIHGLDLLLSIAGPIAEVTGYAATTAVHRMETEDLVVAAARFVNGALGVIEATTTAYPGSPERIDIVGTKGAASLLGGTTLRVDYHDGGNEQIAPAQTIGGTGADPMAMPADYHRAVWADFISAITNGHAPRVSGRDALRVHWLIDALLASSESGRPVQVQG